MLPELDHRELAISDGQTSFRRNTGRHYLIGIALFTIFASIVGIYSSSVPKNGSYTINAEEGTRENIGTEFRSANCINANRPVLDGFDVVAYFHMDPGHTAVKGKEGHEYSHNGWRFWFANKRNRVRFQANPFKYLPKWGGFCAWGMSEESWWTPSNLGPRVDPNVWAIFNESLYLFLEEEPMHYFTNDTRKYIKDGDTRWAAWFPDENSPFNTNCFWDSRQDAE